MNRPPVPDPDAAEPGCACVGWPRKTRLDVGGHAEHVQGVARAADLAVVHGASVAANDANGVLDRRSEAF
jgi:hypothetical protein